MQLQCPRCGQPVHGEDLDLSRGVGVCRPCGEIVPFPSPPDAALAVTPFSPTTGRVYRPASYALVERTTDVAGAPVWEGVLPPNRLVAVPLLFFCLVWDTFMVVWYAIAFSSRVWIMAAFGVLHLAAGVFLTHKAIVTLLNTRRLAIGRGTVTWRSGPVPDRGNVALPIERVVGFSPRVTQGKTTTYSVAMNLDDGSFRDLDVLASDAASAEYAAATFQDALAAAKEIPADGPYRG
jgi:hypothetical protein